MLITKAEAARRLGVTFAAISYKVSKTGVPVTTVGGRALIDDSDLDKLSPKRSLEARANMRRGANRRWERARAEKVSS